MADSAKAVQAASDIEAESREVIDAAKSEEQRGEFSLSLGLLREAIEKERNALDLMAQGIEILQQALDERRSALDQQEDVLAGMVDPCADRDRS